MQEGRNEETQVRLGLRDQMEVIIPSSFDLDDRVVFGRERDGFD